MGLGGLRIAAATSAQVRATGLFNATLESATQDPTQITSAFTATIAILAPWVRHLAAGLAPLGLLVWLVAFGVGRSALLRRYDARLPARRWLLASCEAVRLLAVVLVCWLWYAAMQWSARYALGPATAEPGAAQAEPNLVLYCALALSVTLGLFMAWSALSWLLVAAPLVALLERCSLAEAVRRSLRLPRVRRQLLEVNVAMGIIKLSLLLLAMVFSASPLPFASNMEGWGLNVWWLAVTLAYCAASDFFKMARLVAFVEYLRPLAAREVLAPLPSSRA